MCKAETGMAEIIVERNGSWAEIIFNRPERRNAINLGFAVLFRDALCEFNAEPDIRAIVLSGVGGAINGGAALALAGDLMVCGRSAFILVGEAQSGMPVPRNVS